LFASQLCDDIVKALMAHDYFKDGNKTFFGKMDELNMLKRGEIANFCEFLGQKLYNKVHKGNSSKNKNKAAPNAEDDLAANVDSPANPGEREAASQPYAAHKASSMQQCMSALQSKVAVQQCMSALQSKAAVHISFAVPHVSCR
jgi:hypothetical protein